MWNKLITWKAKMVKYININIYDKKLICKDKTNMVRKIKNMHPYKKV